MRVRQHQSRPGLPLPYPALAPVSGIAWMKPWEPPYFPLRMASYRQQSEATFVLPAMVTVGITGLGWFNPLHEPYFSRKTKHFIHQSSPAYGSRFALPVPISGMAWYVAFDQPKRKTVPSWLMPAEFRMFVAQHAGISGMAWYYAWDQPKQRRVDPTLQQYSMWDARFMWQGTVHVRIMGGGR